MKNKYFKLGDFIIIGTIVIIIILVFVMALNKYSVNIDDAIVEIVYKNEVVVEAKIDENAKYTIKSADDLTKVLIYKNDVLIKEIKVYLNDDFYNIIVISDSTIHMEDASCKNKECMKTDIDQNHTLPIICTNGVVVRLVEDDGDVDVIS